MKGYKKMDEEILFASLIVNGGGDMGGWEGWEVRGLRRWNLLERERQLE